MSITISPRCFLAILLLSIFPIKVSLAGSYTDTSNALKNFNSDICNHVILDAFTEQRDRIGPGIFEKAVTTFFKKCISSQSEATRHLKQQKFILQAKISPEDVLWFSKHWEMNSGSFDSAIIGYRGTGWKRFWDVLAVYRVVIFFKDGEVIRAWAKVERTYP